MANNQNAGNTKPLLSSLQGDGGRGYGAEPYRGEGGLASGGEYHNSLEPFLGPPTKKIDAEPHMRFPHEAWFLPDAYSGRNDYIRETIVQMVINYNAFMTREILPWREQDNPNIAWDSIKFDKTLIDMEPEQGIPRYVTVEREAHTDYMVRRGLALIVNHGFAATPGGQKDFMYKVATIAGAVQETCDQAGVVAILRAKNEYRAKIVEDMKSAADSYDLFHHELWRWGIIQHTERGWYHMDAEAQHVMRCENIQPDTWIVPPRMTSFAAMGQMAETEVYRAGEATARGNLLRGEDNFATFRGKSVYEIKPYQLDVDGRVVDPLNRSRMIGDFFVVPCYDIAKDADGPAYPRFGKGRTQVYCCESDSFETFSWKDVVDKSEFHACETGMPDAELRDYLEYNPTVDSRTRALILTHALAIQARLRNPDVDNNVPADVAELADLVRKELPFLAPVLKDGDVRPQPDEHVQLHGRGGRSHIAAGIARNSSASRFGSNSAEHPEASAALRKAVISGIALKYSVPESQVEDPTVAAETYAATMVAAGHTAAQAGPHMLDAIHDQIAQNIDTHHPYIEHADLTGAPVDHIQHAYVGGEESMGPLDLAIDQGTEHAIRAAKASGNPKWAGYHIGNRGERDKSKNSAINKDDIDLQDEFGAYQKTFDKLDAAQREDKKARGNPAPFDLLCMRPFRQYTMGTGVLCKKGNELGNTFRGWADFQLTDNIIAKTHIGHFTFWHASIVTNPKCLFLAEDIFCTNYEAGEGRTILSWKHAQAFREDPIGTMRQNSASIIAMPVPVGAISPFDHRLQMNNPVSLTGSLDPNVRELTGRQDACKVHIGDYESEGTTSNTLRELRALWKAKAISMSSDANRNTLPVNRLAWDPDNIPCPPDPDTDDRYNKHYGCGGQVLSDIYDAIWGFSGMNHSVDYQNSGSFETSARLINTICFHTMQKFQNPQNMRWEVTNLNTGHFGENGIYEGVKKIRCGFLDYFKEMNYQKAMAMGGQNI